MRILNCTNHHATETQKAMNVITAVNDELLKKAILFTEPPTLERIMVAVTVVLEAMKENECDVAMIGGAPFLQGYLEKALFENGYKVAFAYSERKVEECVLANGDVEKKSYFSSNTMIIKDKDGALEIIKVK